MSDILKEAEDQSKLGCPSQERIFLEFQYPEIRDLLKHFLTLISASLVFSVTFSEKMINFNNAGIWKRFCVVGAWGALILALGFCGIGIYTLYLAADRALEGLTSGTHLDYEEPLTKSYLCQDVAGCLFGLGLFMLVATALWNF